jgi:hypothetical protein
LSFQPMTPANHSPLGKRDSVLSAPDLKDCQFKVSSILGKTRRCQEDARSGRPREPSSGMRSNTVPTTGCCPRKARQHLNSKSHTHGVCGEGWAGKAFSSARQGASHGSGRSRRQGLEFRGIPSGKAAFAANLRQGGPRRHSQVGRTGFALAILRM